MKILKHTLPISIVLACCSLTSCYIDVPLCNESEHPHRGNLTINCDWNGTTVTGPVYVMARRPINNAQYCFETTTAASVAEGTPIYYLLEDHDIYEAKDTIVEGKDTIVVDVKETAMRIHCGEYEFLCGSFPRTVISEFQSKLKECPQTPLDSMWVKYDVINLENIVGADEYPLYVGRGEGNVPVANDAALSVDIAPASVCQTVNIQFGYTPVDTITVEKVECELRGAYNHLQPSTGLLDGSTYNIQFIPTLPTLPSTDMSQTLYVLGLAKNSELKVVFTISTTEEGEPVTKKVERIIDLSTLLASKPSVKMVNGQTVQSENKTIELNIAEKLQLQ